MDFRRIDVLLNKETQERFDEKDIVKITTNGTYGREYIGKIIWIETLELTLDMSDKYNSDTTNIKYKDILKIEKYE